MQSATREGRQEGSLPRAALPAAALLATALLLAPAAAAQDKPAAEPAGKPASSVAAADERPPLELALSDELSLRPSLQYRLRYRHHEGHDFAAGGVTDTLRHRARLGLELMYEERLGVMAQLQDVRFLGEETDTLGDYSADGLDLHQAYAILRPWPELSLRLGRQEIAFENERIIGTVGWSEQARSLDALRLTYEADGVRVDGFYSLLRESSEGLGQAGDGAALSAKRHLAAVNVHYRLLPALSPGVVVVTEHDDGQDKHQHTAGAIATGQLLDGILSYSAEGYYQAGTAAGGIHFSSYLAAVQARATVPVALRPYLEIGGDFLSGDDRPGDLTRKTFEVPFGTNHKFYGEMDFFLSMPVHTQERGLRDILVAAGLLPLDGLHARVAYHFFQAMAEQADGLTTFGHELDTFIEYKFLKHARVKVLYAWFVPQSIMEQGSSDASLEHFVYTTAEVTF